MATITKPKRESKKFTTPVFRASFPNIAEAREPDDGGKAKFGVSAIWTPSKFTDGEKTQYRAILAELDAVSLRDFKKNWKKLPDNIKRGLRDGAAKEQEGYGEGTRFANLTTHNRPGVVTTKRRLNKKTGKQEWVPIPEDKIASEIYPGCYCRATVNVYSYGLKAGSKGKGVAIGLINIQKVKDGARLDNRVNAEDDFDEELDAAWMDEADGNEDFDDFDGDDADDGDEDEAF